MFKKSMLPSSRLAPPSSQPLSCWTMQTLAQTLNCAGRSYAGCGLEHDYALLTLDRDIGSQVGVERRGKP